MRPLVIVALLASGAGCGMRSTALGGEPADGGAERCLDIAPAFPVSYARALDEQVLTAWYAWSEAWPGCIAAADGTDGERDPAMELRLWSFDVSARELTVQAAMNREHSTLACTASRDGSAATARLLALVDEFEHDPAAVRADLEQLHEIANALPALAARLDRVAASTCAAVPQPGTPDAP